MHGNLNEGKKTKIAQRIIIVVLFVSMGALLLTHRDLLFLSPDNSSRCPVVLVQIRMVSQGMDTPIRKLNCCEQTSIMNDSPNIRLIYAHPKRNRGDDAL